MLLGVGTVLYALTVLAQAVLQSEIVEALGLRQRIREMKKLEITISFVAQGASGAG